MGLHPKLDCPELQAIRAALAEADRNDTRDVLAARKSRDAGRAIEAAWRYFDHRRRVNLTGRAHERGVPACSMAEMDVRMALMDEAVKALEGFRETWSAQPKEGAP
jgi:hypothetical protein